MWLLTKVVFFLVVVAAIGLVGYAYLGPTFMPSDFQPDVQEVIKPVTLGGG